MQIKHCLYKCLAFLVAVIISTQTPLTAVAYAAGTGKSTLDHTTRTFENQTLEAYVVCGNSINLNIDATDVSEVLRWGNSDPSVTSYTDTARGKKVTAVKAGTSLISCTLEDYTYECTIISVATAAELPTVTPVTTAKLRYRDTVINHERNVTFTPVIISTLASDFKYTYSLTAITGQPEATTLASIDTSKGTIKTKTTYGKVTINCTAKKGSETYTASTTLVIGPVKATKIAINDKNQSFTLNTNFSPAVTLWPSDVTNKTVKITSDNPNIKTTASGAITCSEEGDYKIKVTTTDGSNLSDSMTVHCGYVALSSIKINTLDIEMSKGQYYKFDWETDPLNATLKNSTQIKVQDTSIATYDSNTGYLYGVKAGTTYIGLKNGTRSAITRITVLNELIYATKFEIFSNDTTMGVDDSGAVTYKVTPENTTFKNLSYSSSNSSVLSVDDEGNLLALAEGTATITVTLDDHSGTPLVDRITFTIGPKTYVKDPSNIKITVASPAMNLTFSSEATLRKRILSNISVTDSRGLSVEDLTTDDSRLTWIYINNEGESIEASEIGSYIGYTVDVVVTYTEEEFPSSPKTVHVAVNMKDSSISDFNSIGSEPIDYNDVDEEAILDEFGVKITSVSYDTKYDDKTQKGNWFSIYSDRDDSGKVKKPGVLQGRALDDEVMDEYFMDKTFYIEYNDTLNNFITEEVVGRSSDAEDAADASQRHDPYNEYFNLNNGDTVLNVSTYYLQEMTDGMELKDANDAGMPSDNLLLKFYRVPTDPEVDITNEAYLESSIWGVTIDSSDVDSEEDEDAENDIDSDGGGKADNPNEATAQTLLKGAYTQYRANTEPLYTPYNSYILYNILGVTYDSSTDTVAPKLIQDTYKLYSAKDYSSESGKFNDETKWGKSTYVDSGYIESLAGTTPDTTTTNIAPSVIKVGRTRAWNYYIALYNPYLYGDYNIMDVSFTLTGPEITTFVTPYREVDVTETWTGEYTSISNDAVEDWRPTQNTNIGVLTVYYKYYRFVSSFDVNSFASSGEDIPPWKESWLPTTNLTSKPITQKKISDEQTIFTISDGIIYSYYITDSIGSCSWLGHVFYIGNLEKTNEVTYTDDRYRKARASAGTETDFDYSVQIVEGSNPEQLQIYDESLYLVSVQNTWTIPYSNDVSLNYNTYVPYDDKFRTVVEEYDDDGNVISTRMLDTYDYTYAAEYFTIHMHRDWGEDVTLTPEVQDIFLFSYKEDNYLVFKLTYSLRDYGKYTCENDTDFVFTIQDPIIEAYYYGSGDSTLTPITSYEDALTRWSKATGTGVGPVNMPNSNIISLPYQPFLSIVYTTQESNTPNVVIEETPAYRRLQTAYPDPDMTFYGTVGVVPSSSENVGNAIIPYAVFITNVFPDCVYHISNVTIKIGSADDSKLRYRYAVQDASNTDNDLNSVNGGWLNYKQTNATKPSIPYDDGLIVFYLKVLPKAPTIRIHAPDDLDENGYPCAAYPVGGSDGINVSAADLAKYTYLIACRISAAGDHWFEDPNATNGQKKFTITTNRAITTLCYGVFDPTQPGYYISNTKSDVTDVILNDNYSQEFWDPDLHGGEMKYVYYKMSTAGVVSTADPEVAVVRNSVDRRILDMSIVTDSKLGGVIKTNVSTFVYKAVDAPATYTMFAIPHPVKIVRGPLGVEYLKLKWDGANFTKEEKYEVLSSSDTTHMSNYTRYLYRGYDASNMYNKPVLFVYKGYDMGSVLVQKPGMTTVVQSQVAYNMSDGGKKVYYLAISCPTVGTYKIDGQSIILTNRNSTRLDSGYPELLEDNNTLNKQYTFERDPTIFWFPGICLYWTDMQSVTPIVKCTDTKKNTKYYEVLTEPAGTDGFIHRFQIPCPGDFEIVAGNYGTGLPLYSDIVTDGDVSYSDWGISVFAPTVAFIGNTPFTHKDGSLSILLDESAVEALAQDIETLRTGSYQQEGSTSKYGDTVTYGGQTYFMGNRGIRTLYLAMPELYNHEYAAYTRALQHENDWEIYCRWMGTDLHLYQTGYYDPNHASLTDDKSADVTDDTTFGRVYYRFDDELFTQDRYKNGEVDGNELPFPNILPLYAEIILPDLNNPYRGGKGYVYTGVAAGSVIGNASSGNFTGPDVINANKRGYTQQVDVNGGVTPKEELKTNGYRGGVMPTNPYTPNANTSDIRSKNSEHSEAADKTPPSNKSGIKTNGVNVAKNNSPYGQSATSAFVYKELQSDFSAVTSNEYGATVSNRVQPGLKYTQIKDHGLLVISPKLDGDTHHNIIQAFIDGKVEDIDKYYRGITGTASIRADRYTWDRVVARPIYTTDIEFKKETHDFLVDSSRTYTLSFARNTRNDYVNTADKIVQDKRGKYLFTYSAYADHNTNLVMQTNHTGVFTFTPQRSQRLTIRCTSPLGPYVEYDVNLLVASEITRQSGDYVNTNYRGVAAMSKENTKAAQTNLYYVQATIDGLEQPFNHDVKTRYKHLASKDNEYMDFEPDALNYYPNGNTRFSSIMIAYPMYANITASDISKYFEGSGAYASPETIDLGTREQASFDTTQTSRMNSYATQLKNVQNLSKISGYSSKYKTNEAYIYGVGSTSTFAQTFALGPIRVANPNCQVTTQSLSTVGFYYDNQGVLHYGDSGKNNQNGSIGDGGTLAYVTKYTEAFDQPGQNVGIISASNEDVIMGLFFDNESDTCVRTKGSPLRTLSYTTGDNQYSDDYGFTTLPDVFVNQY